MLEDGKLLNLRSVAKCPKVRSVSKRPPSKQNVSGASGTKREPPKKSGTSTTFYMQGPMKRTGPEDHGILAEC